MGSDVHPSPKWGKGAKLFLQNTEVKALQDREDSWPNELELTGFTYSRLGGLTSAESKSMATREVKWLKSWLEKQSYYSPQPYEQLAKVLKEEGYPSKARNVLYWSKNREETASKDLNHYWLKFLKWTIGYGYKLYYIFIWLLGMSAIGSIFLICSNQGPAKYVKQREISENCTKRMLTGVFRIFKRIVVNFFYSLDMLFPVIKFNEWNKVELVGSTKVYFYIHKRIGYILSFVIVAWLTGIIYK